MDNLNTIFGLAPDFYVEQINHFKAELQKQEDWELQAELEVQTVAYGMTKAALDRAGKSGLREPGYEQDLVLIVYRLSAITDEIKRRFIP